jgi:hypothetical protein
MKRLVNREWRVRLSGITWEGFEGSIVHTFTHNPTKDEIRAKSGDFEIVNDCIVAEITTSERTVYEEAM